MRMKKGLLVVVALLAMASVMAAMAFNTAKITNNGSVRVKNTSESLVGLTNMTAYAGELGNKDATVVIENGQLVFRFGWGKSSGSESKMYGVQRNSEYIWDSPFYIWTESIENVEVTLSATGDLANYITFGTDGAGQPGTAAWASTVTYTNKHITNGSGLKPAIKITMPKDDAHSFGTDLSGEIVVTAVAK